MAVAPFTVDPHLTSIAIGYRNTSLIADEVLPRVPVGKQEYKWREFNLGDAFTVPNTTVGRTSKPNQIEFTSEEKTSSTTDHALDHPVPYADIANQPENYDIRGKATERTTDLILLDREVRVAKTVFNKNNFLTSNVQTLTGNAQWSHDDSRPIATISDALDKVIMRPNRAVLGHRVATLLRRNKSVLRAYNGSTGEDGMVPLEFLKELFGLDKILVGSAFLNISKPGKTPTIVHAWGNHAAFIYTDELADTHGGLTFGMTAQFGNRISGSIEDKDMGMRGGERVRVGESVDEIVVAKAVGCLFENAIADS